MKKLLRWFLNWMSGDALDEVDRLREQNKRQNDLCATLAQDSLALEKLRIEYQHLRSQVMQLRVENSDPKQLGRLGWQVSAFIPEETLRHLRTHPQIYNAFVNRIAAVLVHNAVQGIVKLNSAGKSVALIFEPLSLESKQRVVSTWLETDKDHPSLIYSCGDNESVRKVLPEADFGPKADTIQRLIDGPK